MDWIMLFYKTFGASHPRASLVAVMILGAAIFGGVWWAIGKEYQRQHPQTSVTAPVDQLTQVRIEELQRKKNEDRIDHLALKLQNGIYSDMTSQLGLVCKAQMKTYLEDDNPTEEEFYQVVGNLELKGILKRQPGLKQDGPWWMVH